VEKISGTQVLFMTALYTTALSIQHSMILMLKTTKQDAWISFIVVAIIALFPLLVSYQIGKRMPDGDFVSVLISRLPFLGRVIMFLYLLVLFFTISHNLRLIIDKVNVHILQQTPLTVVGLVIILTCIFIAKGGLEILARMSEIFFPLFALTILSLPFFLVGESHLSFLQPMFTEGVGPILLGAWYAIGYIGEIIVIPLILSKSVYNVHKAIQGLFLGVFLLIVTLIQTILIFGPEMPTLYFDPPYELVRQIRITDFLDRMDLPIVSLWIPTLIIKISITLYAISHIISRLFQNISSELFITPIGFLAFVCSFFFFDSATQIIEMGKVKPFMILIISYLLPLLMWILLRVKQRKNNENLQTKNTKMESGTT
jgi:spore germination protein